MRKSAECCDAEHGELVPGFAWSTGHHHPWAFPQIADSIAVVQERDTLDARRFETVSRTKNARPTRTIQYVKMGNFRQIKYWLLHISAGSNVLPIQLF